MKLPSSGIQIIWPAGKLRPEYEPVVVCALILLLEQHKTFPMAYYNQLVLVDPLTLFPIHMPPPIFMEQQYI